jgi:hypothetical protein
MTPCCRICGRPGPTGPGEFIAGRWFHMDPDGSGPIPPVWICGEGNHPDEEVLQAVREAVTARGTGQSGGVVA